MSMPQARASVLFFGMVGELSSVPLEALLRSGVTVRAIVMPAFHVTRESAPYRVLAPSRARAQRSIHMLGVEPHLTTPEIASKHAIPVLEVARLRHHETLDALRVFAPDLICVSCFTRRLPPEVLDIPRLGAANLHPSLLPDNRGPDPLFWTFRRGDAQTGVTVHLMDGGLDTGPILTQEVIPLHDGMSEAELLRLCARTGARVLTETVDDMIRGVAVPRPQNEAAATTYSWPGTEDYQLLPDRSARWAYNFCSGIIGRGQPVTVDTGNAHLRIIEPLTFDPADRSATSWEPASGLLHLRCNPGVFVARAAIFGT